MQAGMDADGRVKRDFTPGSATTLKPLPPVFFAHTKTGYDDLITQPSQNYTVLIAEDIPLHRAILRKILGKLGLAVVEARTTEQAMQCLRRSGFHMVFLDWNFPDGTGEAVAAHIRDHLPQTRLVITSADLSPDMLEHYRRNGAHHIIGKLYTLADVRDALSAIPAPAIDTPAKTAPAPSHARPRLTARQHAAFSKELHSLKNALADGRAADAARAAHNAHGIARMLGFTDIALISRQMEIAVGAGESAEAHLAELERELGDQSPDREGPSPGDLS